MSVDFKAVATAVAVRFGQGTPPTNQPAIALATAALPDAIVMEPTVLVFPVDQVTFSYPPSARKGVASYPVRFYLFKVRDTPRNTDLLNDWMTALHTVLDGQVQLGLSSSGVNGAEISAATTGVNKYADIDYYGIEFTVKVEFGYGVNFVA